MDGSQGMGWHSDDEPEMLPFGAIASVSLGAERKFVFKHKKLNTKVELWLAPGSLLVMKGMTQRHWLHSLPKSKKIKEPRINLTFRTIVS
ncbi:2-oxoglutarate-Fe(II)-dependent oxygenase superfamily protein [Marinoscillum furvescens DSM 4134]|uniref:2-oxoglutarate-Fe(II)-dependent oxygenase superfamily protein n=1 Tax=Marinoscillum furvescens DSM 4134 TaxID=1122208 RepID=A0A3D9L1F1_MARFU|nr:2-oxoglutarate-Fe(II)-dependent oxygenase superfamily protein [Marinoscillum furvescens DSM 4134]